MSEYYAKQKSNQVKVGLFSLIGFLILILGYSWFQNYLNSFKYTELRVLFQDVNNIEPGSSVSIYGVKKGTVKKLQITEKGVMLFLNVELNIKLKKDAKFVIKEVDLMGSRQVDIFPGKSNEILDCNEVLAGDVQSGMSQLVFKMNQMVGKIDLFIHKLSGDEGVLSKLNNVADTSTELLTSVVNFLDTNEKDISELLENAKESTKELSSLLKENKPIINQSLVSANNLFNNIENKLNVLDSTMINLNQITDDINSSESTFKKLMTEKDLHDNIMGLTTSIDSLIIDIKKNPKKYFTIEIF